MAELIAANTVLTALAIAFTASFMQSLTGFGLSIIATPLLLIIYEPKQVVLILQIICLFINTVFGFLLRKHVDGPFLFKLTVGAMFGQPVGLLIYQHVPGGVMKIAISLLILSFMLVMHFYREPVRETDRRTWIVGFISGLLNTATSISGPPLILYLASTQREKTSMRATSIVYFAITNVTAIITFLLVKEPLDFALQQASVMLPAAFAGLLLGNALFSRISYAVFQRLIFIMLLFSSAYTIYATI